MQWFYNQSIVFAIKACRKMQKALNPDISELDINRRYLERHLFIKLFETKKSYSTTTNHCKIFIISTIFSVQQLSEQWWIKPHWEMKQSYIDLLSIYPKVVIDLYRCRDYFMNKHPHAYFMFSVRFWQWEFVSCQF